jgi:hypothetical protein
MVIPRPLGNANIKKPSSFLKKSFQITNHQIFSGQMKDISEEATVTQDKRNQGILFFIFAKFESSPERTISIVRK